MSNSENWPELYPAAAVGKPKQNLPDIPVVSSDGEDNSTEAIDGQDNQVKQAVANASRLKRTGNLVAVHETADANKQKFIDCFYDRWGDLAETIQHSTQKCHATKLQDGTIVVYEREDFPYRLNTMIHCRTITLESSVPGINSCCKAAVEAFLKKYNLSSDECEITYVNMCI